MASIIQITQPDLTKLPKTALVNDEPALETSLAVENGLSFSNNDYVLISGYGTSDSEIAQVSGAGTATTVTLGTGLSSAQTRGATIQKTYYNQIDIEYSENLETLWETGAYATLSAASAAATWTNLTTIGINPREDVTEYQDTSANTRAYRTRYYNATSGLYSGYGDPILPDGFESESVGDIILSALSETNTEMGQEDGDELVQDVLLRMFNSGLQHVNKQRKRWSYNQLFDQDISEITAGKNEYDLPFNMDTRLTNKSTWGVRIKNGNNLTYIDKREYDEEVDDVVTTTLAAQLTAVSTTATVTDSSNLPDEGSFVVTTGTTQDTVSWDSNNRTTNVLTLSATTGVTVTHASGTDIWHQGSFSDDPGYYTIYGRKLVIWPIPDTGLYQRNITMDYYQKLVKVDSFGDYLQYPDPKLMLDYMCWKIKTRTEGENAGLQYKQDFETGLNTMIKNEVTGQDNEFTLGISKVQ